MKGYGVPWPKFNDKKPHTHVHCSPDIQHPIHTCNLHVADLIIIIIIIIEDFPLFVSRMSCIWEPNYNIICLQQFFMGLILIAHA